MTNWSDQGKALVFKGKNEACPFIIVSSRTASPDVSVSIRFSKANQIDSTVLTNWSEQPSQGQGQIL